jgi:hypothetical protein
LPVPSDLFDEYPMNCFAAKISKKKAGGFAGLRLLINPALFGGVFIFVLVFEGAKKPLRPRWA